MQREIEFNKTLCSSSHHPFNPSQFASVTAVSHSFMRHFIAIMLLIFQETRFTALNDGTSELGVAIMGLRVFGHRVIKNINLVYGPF